jgi:hypothetical protein
MIDTTSLSILQYNVQKSKNITMAPLLADPEVQKYHILAIQEPWKNPTIHTSYNPSSSAFHLVYRPEENTRVAFYINKELEAESWTAETPTPDLCILTLTIRYGHSLRKIQIINIYNPSPTSYNSYNSPSTLPALHDYLSQHQDIEHIVLGDFNLHHPFWGGIARPLQHRMADQLLDLVGHFALDLATLVGTRTRSGKG